MKKAMALLLACSMVLAFAACSKKQYTEQEVTAVVDVTDENGKTTQVAQSEFDKASNLRAGDTIIVRGENIYNGKVVTD